MDSVINSIIEDINSHNEWSLDEKIRYAYISLGKKVHLNIEFFYTLYNLLHEEYRLSIDELNEIYEEERSVAYVICKDAARMLKKIFDGCGINSKIKETIEVDHYKLKDGEIDIQHFFNVVEGNDNRQYFLSLILDLPYIQLGMKTEHFATNVVYHDDEGNQVYNGEEINNTVLSSEYIEQLDKKIGYLSLKFDDENSKTTYYNEAFNRLISANRKNKYYYYKMSFNMENEFYNGLVKMMSDDSECMSFKLSSLNEEKINDIKKYICLSIRSKIDKEVNFSNVDYEHFDTNFENTTYIQFLKDLDLLLKEKDYKSDDGMFSLNALTTSGIKLFDVLDKLPDANKLEQKDINKLKNLLNHYIYNIAKVYIPREYRHSANFVYTNEYLEHKIRVLLPEVFDFFHDTDFTNLHIGEKSVIVSRVMHALFPELQNDKTVDRKKEDSVENRIRTCMLFDKEELLYKMVINIEQNESGNDIVLLYNFNDGYNYFEEQDLSLLDMKSNYDKYMFFSKNLGIPAERNVEEIRSK